MTESSRETFNPNSDLGFTGLALPRVYLKLAASHARYYKIHVLDDGYPAQRLDDGRVYEHPLYPTYLMDEYIAQYAATGNQGAIDAAKLIADASLARMEAFRGALVFWYPADGVNARAWRRHYSALTQAYYARCFFDLFLALGDLRYEDAALRAFSSLRIDTRDEGVARYLPYGIAIEELPLDTPDLILNGWLSAIAVLCEKPELISGLNAADFIKANLDALEYLLPRYDCPEYLNSRYSLSGPLYLRLRVVTSGVSLALRNAKLVLSNGMSFAIGRGDYARWRNHVFEKDVQSWDGDWANFVNRNARINVVASQFALPNVLHFRVRARTLAKVVLEGFIGNYDPLASAPVEGCWRRLGAIRLFWREQSCEIAIPEDAMALVGYPTNFAKVLDGRNRNIYHSTHIDRLEQILRYQERPTFRFYAQKWREYVAEWPNDPRYAPLVGGSTVT